MVSETGPEAEDQAFFDLSYDYNDAAVFGGFIQPTHGGGIRRCALSKQERQIVIWHDGS